MEEKKFYTVGESAHLLGVHANTIINWINEGKLKAMRTAGGHRRIPAEEIKRFLKQVEDEER